MVVVLMIADYTFQFDYTKLLLGVNGCVNAYAHSALVSHPGCIPMKHPVLEQDSDPPQP